MKVMHSPARRKPPVQREGEKRGKGRTAEKKGASSIPCHCGIEALVAAMGRHAESPGVQEWAAGALCILAARSDLRQRIKRAGAGEAVRRAMAVPAATADTKTWGQKVLDALKKV